MSSKEVIPRVGWFPARSYEGDAVIDGGKIKIMVRNFRPKYEINAVVYKADYSAIEKGVIEFGVKDGDKLADYIYLHVPSTVTGTGWKYRVLVME